MHLVDNCFYVWVLVQNNLHTHRRISTRSYTLHSQLGLIAALWYSVYLSYDVLVGQHLVFQVEVRNMPNAFKGSRSLHAAR